MTSLRCLSLSSVIALWLLACGDDGSGTGGSGTTSVTSGPGSTTSSTTAATTTSATTGTGGGTCNLGTLPTSYDGAAYDTNAATSLALRSQLGALNTQMQSAEADLMITPTAAELQALYDAGTPSLSDVATAEYDARTLLIFADFEAAAGDIWVPTEPPVEPGGKYGNWIFNERGVDLRQGVEKASFMGAFYNHALTLTQGGVDQADLDALLAIYGAHPSFPGDSSMTPMYPDRIAAQYAERRSPKDPADPSLPLDPSNPGPYFRIKSQFIRAQAAIAIGADCDAERDAAIDAILDEWDHVIAATVIFYLNDASVKLTDVVPDLPAALHSYGEAIAFLYGYRGLPNNARVITDMELEDLLAALGAPVGEEATAYQLALDPTTEVQNLLDGIATVATIYGFSQAEIDSFKVAH